MASTCGIVLANDIAVRIDRRRARLQNHICISTPVNSGSGSNDDLNSHLRDGIYPFLFSLCSRARPGSEVHQGARHEF